MIEDGLVPDIGHGIGRERPFQHVRTKSPQPDGQKTKRRREPKESRIHDPKMACPLRGRNCLLGLIVLCASPAHLIRHTLRAVEGAFRPIMFRDWSRSRRSGDRRYAVWLGCGDRIVTLPLPNKQRRDTEDQKKKHLHGIKREHCLGHRGITPAPVCGRPSKDGGSNNI